MSGAHKLSLDHRYNHSHGMYNRASLIYAEFEADSSRSASGTAISMGGTYEVGIGNRSDVEHSSNSDCIRSTTRLA